MKKLEYTVRFNTPAFLGNAEQSGQWRTPPFKALLRQWWRVAYAADHQYPVNPNGMRTEEGLLFGHAWLENDRDEEGRQVAARKSLVRMRLSSWEAGKLKAWPAPDVTVPHREVPRPVGSQLYMGYGPLVSRNGTALKANAAIQEDESATLSLAVPDKHAPRIERALMLMDRYGALGGRSRNGWGSFALTPLEETPPLTGDVPLRPWKDALGLDWPHAIGKDARALTWQTTPFDNLKTLMRELAIIKIGLRTRFQFPNVRPPHNTPLDRHWLSYPITKHTVNGWGNKRLPNSLRFKVRALPDGKLAGVIFHVPCLPPPEFRPDHRTIESVWQRVHAFLDDPTQKLTRIPA